MLLKSIEDVGATMAWFPSKSASMIALGTKEALGSGFDDYGAKLEIHSVDLGSNDVSSKAAGVAKTSSRFVSLAWSKPKAGLALGLVAGGMSDGAVDIWDAAKLVAGHPQAHVSRVSRHSGAVNGVEFNPHASSSHLLASGGADGEVYIMALERPEEPTVFVPAPAAPNAAKATAEVTRVAWNSQVSHILATASASGSCVVWDLRKKQPWCELRDGGASVSAVAWNPSEGLHLATATGDDANPVIRLWDLRSSTTMPLGTLRGHTQGVLSMSWCPDDPSLLVSCGRDNRTLLWDLYTTQPVYELSEAGASKQAKTDVVSGLSSMALGGGGGGGPVAASFAFDASPAGGGFGGAGGGGGGFGGGSAGRRYEVAWSPSAAAVLATCSFDRKVQLHSLAGVTTSSKRSPAWLKRPCGAAFGFGGKLAAFGATKGRENVLRLQSFIENEGLVAASRDFESALEASEYAYFCRAKSRTVSEDEERVWAFMQLIFEPNARERLLECLGYDAAAIAEQCGAKLKAESVVAPPAPSSSAAAAATDASSAEDVFGGARPPAPPGGGADERPSGAPEAPSAVVRPPRAVAPETERAVRSALLVGNFDAAVECCLAAGELADALLLASCGGAELWEKTRSRYFCSAQAERPWLEIVSAIITNELGDLVEQSDLAKWEETLAILSTYGKPEEFPPLCEQLGARLEVERGDKRSAALCYMCAVNAPKTLRYWLEDYRVACRANGGRTDTSALQELVEKVTLFNRDEPSQLESVPELATLFGEYATLLASQGELAVAAKYCAASAASDPGCALLLDRLDPSRGTKPFQEAPIGISPDVRNGGAKPQPSAAARPVVHHQQPQQQQQQQPAVQPQQAQQPHQLPAQQQQQPAVQPSSDPSAGAIPAPWVATVDPASGMTYYANTQTGATQWEPPVAPAPAPRAVAPRTMPQPAAAATPAAAAARAVPATASPYAAAPAASPYAAAVPTMAAQPAAAAPQQQQQQQAAAAQAVVSNPVVPVNVLPITEGLESLLAHLRAAALNGSEKRQLVEMDKAVSALTAKFTAGTVSPEVTEQVSHFVGACMARDYATASSIQVGLVNTDWATHKDWLKGIKFLMQLAQKKL